MAEEFIVEDKKSWICGFLGQREGAVIKVQVNERHQIDKHGEFCYMASMIKIIKANEQSVYTLNSVMSKEELEVSDSSEEGPES